MCPFCLTLIYQSTFNGVLVKLSIEIIVCLCTDIFPQIYCSFPLSLRLFFVIEFVNGGDLMFHMQRQRRLPEEHARFYAAEICLALNFLHEKGK